MNKEELAKRYADKKVAKKWQYIDCDFDVRKELTTFDGYDIEQAFEDGYDKAVKLTRKCLIEWSSGYIAKTTGGGVNARKRLANDVLNYLEEYMEGKDDGTLTKFMGSYTTTTETDNGKKYKDYRKDK